MWWFHNGVDMKLIQSVNQIQFHQFVMKGDNVISILNTHCAIYIKVNMRAQLLHPLSVVNKLIPLESTSNKFTLFKHAINTGTNTYVFEFGPILQNVQVFVSHLTEISIISYLNIMSTHLIKFFQDAIVFFHDQRFTTGKIDNFYVIKVWLYLFPQIKMHFGRDIFRQKLFTRFHLCNLLCVTIPTSAQLRAATSALKIADVGKTKIPIHQTSFIYRPVCVCNINQISVTIEISIGTHAKRVCAAVLLYITPRTTLWSFVVNHLKTHFLDQITVVDFFYRLFVQVTGDIFHRCHTTGVCRSIRPCVQMNPRYYTEIIVFNFCSGWITKLLTHNPSPVHTTPERFPQKIVF